LLGLAFKPNVADLRESPALQVAHALSTQTTARLLAVEPNVTELPAGLGRVEWSDLGSALEQADIVAVLVGHQEFRDLPRHRLQGKHVIDVTGVLAASGRP
jgi:UDP-N-acetyl-D-mannosaminuronic acid dehydrogenase